MAQAREKTNEKRLNNTVYFCTYRIRQKKKNRIEIFHNRKTIAHNIPRTQTKFTENISLACALCYIHSSTSNIMLKL